MLVNIFDTRISDNNLGNAIIMDAVDKVIDELFPNAFLLRHSCLDPVGKTSKKYLREGKYTFFGGTNMLCSHMETCNQWEIAPSREDVANVILCGLGWVQYQDDVDAYTKQLLFDVLHHSIYHSVRDGYTEKKLRGIGMQNVFNTGCPTMWGLTPEHCKTISRAKGESVLVTLTNYNQNPKLDAALLNVLQKQYKKLHLWVQGPEDHPYAKALCPQVEIISPRLSALDDFLASDRDIEYVGTRLHAGIRAMQFGRRATIVAIDNRATEISRDTGLFTVPREKVADLSEILRSLRTTELTLPWRAIENWKKQFA